MPNNYSISVIVPVYNTPIEMLTETLHSIEMQSLVSFETVVVNDGSDAGELSNFLSQWVKASDGVRKRRVITLTKNVGVSECLRVGWNAAEGSYIAAIGHDDVLLPHHLSELLSIVLRDEDIVAAFNDVAYIDGRGKRIENNIFNHSLAGSLSAEDLNLRLTSGNFVCMPASLVRAEGMDILWGFGNNSLHDAELWIKLSTLGKFYFNKKVGLKYRVLEKSESHRNAGGIKHLDFCLMIYRCIPYYKQMLSQSVDPENYLFKLMKVFDAHSDYLPQIRLVKLQILNELRLDNNPFLEESSLGKHQAKCLLEIGAFERAQQVTPTSLSLIEPTPRFKCYLNVDWDHRQIADLISAETNLDVEVSRTQYPDEKPQFGLYIRCVCDESWEDADILVKPCPLSHEITSISKHSKVIDFEVSQNLNELRRIIEVLYSAKIGLMTTIYSDSFLETTSLKKNSKPKVWRFLMKRLILRIVRLTPWKIQNWFWRIIESIRND